MTNQETPQTDAPAIKMDDPRMGFAKVTEAVGGLMETVTEDQLGLPTPCPEFSVKDLLEHKVMVMKRVAAIGNGHHWSSVTEEHATMVDGHAAAFRSAAHDVMEAWTDSAKLEQVVEVPWGELPGGPALLTYTAELVTHGWDLATAIGTDFEVADEHLGGALFAAKMLPGEGREDPEFPFDPVVDPGPTSPLLLQIAGWLGRKVA